MVIIHEPSRRGHRKSSIGATEGSVLGIDVGWSEKKDTTGLSLIKWEEGAIRWYSCKAAHDMDDRRRKLSQLVKGERLLAVGIDGPLLKNLRQLREPKNRAVDSLFMRGKFQYRGKAGSTKGGSGPRLHEHATLLANLVVNIQNVDPATYPYKIHDKAVVEAFPNAFLAVLHPEKNDEEFPKPEKARRWTDALFRFPLVKQKLDQLLGDVLTQYELAFSLAEIKDHEDVASFVCALTALCVADGRCVAVGDEIGGYIALPPLCLWGESSTGTGKWALITLCDNYTSVHRKFKGEFKNLTLYENNKSWDRDRNR